ncbi:MAG TPA: histidine kinase dimerization/phosphoacceptor domain -containing protein [Sphingomicrobium sp.]|nr:histidine kinase dimerization/phosphoacceptor domain -containing protein [Sphingomicrobium sp.]
MKAFLHRFDSMATGPKVILLLSAALLPLGLALAWTTRNSIRASELAVVDLARRQGLSAATAINSLIARNTLALRVAANSAARAGGADPCSEMSLSLALTPAVAQTFMFRDSDGSIVCSKGDMQNVSPDRFMAPGAIDVWAAPAERALFYRVGVIDGMATGRLTVDELAAAVRDTEPMVRDVALRDSQGAVLDIIAARGEGRGEQWFRSAAPIADGRMTAMLQTAAPIPGLNERLAMLLPILMFFAAAVGAWLLVKLLLTRPLSRLQRAINEYRPGERLVLPARLGSAEEIRSLGAAFERAVDRIEESEHHMAEALEGQRRLVREVHHRVKNNLQVIASLLSIHGRSASTAESRDAYAAIGRRVDALSVVHRNHFAEVEDSVGIPLRPLLVELTAILRASAPQSASGLVIQLDAEPLFTTQDAAVAVSFFVTEVVEYAMLAAPGEPIDVELHRLSELAAMLTVSSGALVDGAEESGSRARDQFDRVIAGLARQLRSPLESKMGRLGVNLPVFPERR